MDETRFKALKEDWLENRELARAHNAACGRALRELIWTLADEGKPQTEIARTLGIGRQRVQEIMNQNRLLTPGFEDLRRETL